MLIINQNILLYNSFWNNIINSTIILLFQFYYALYGFTARNNNEITLFDGQVVTVLKKHDQENNTDWWLVDADGVKGYAPANYLQPMGWQDIIPSANETTRYNLTLTGEIIMTNDIEDEMQTIIGVVKMMCFTDMKLQESTVVDLWTYILSFGYFYYKQLHFVFEEQIFYTVYSVINKYCIIFSVWIDIM